MDLLSQRYANPYMILDDFIRLEQLYDFTIEILKTIADEKVHEARWQFFLHKVWDMTFEEYLAKCEGSAVRHPQSKPKAMDKDQIKSVLKKSEDILDGFVL